MDGYLKTQPHRPWPSKFNDMNFRNHDVARDRQKDSNVDEMLLNSISAHRQSVFKFFESPFWDPINRGESQPIELATPCMV
jgi:hypothetical protein